MNERLSRDYANFEIPDFISPYDRRSHLEQLKPIFNNCQRQKLVMLFPFYTLDMPLALAVGIKGNRLGAHLFTAHGNSCFQDENPQKAESPTELVLSGEMVTMKEVYRKIPKFLARYYPQLIGLPIIFIPSFAIDHKIIPPERTGGILKFSTKKRRIIEGPKRKLA